MTDNALEAAVWAGAGQMTEGAFASYLYDLTDTPSLLDNASNSGALEDVDLDGASISPAEIGRLMRECRVTWAFSPISPITERITRPMTYTRDMAFCVENSFSALNEGLWPAVWIEDLWPHDWTYLLISGGATLNLYALSRELRDYDIFGVVAP